MIESDTPRSYTSPRDDRFFTPRTLARTNSTSTGASDEWTTPRHEAEFVTPRSLADERRDTARSMQSYSSARSFGDAAPQAKQSSSSYIDNHYFQQGSTQRSQAPFSGSGYRPAAESKSYSRGEDSLPMKQTEIDFSAANIDEDDIEDVFRFARHGRLEEVERLLEKGVPVDVKDMNGNSLLIIACQNGNKRVAKAVLRRGANINARNFKGNTPLHYCYQYGYGETLGQYLISKGADHEARNNAGNSTWQGI